ncbi:hypothetical protein K490DRAFT_62169 [Saccharata proteae CBS 121410]|uniref:Uncharacterized protein n=1 Tax=Saccharata proteae CBS 121410 TaxID=1314787 RepID=A0A9P4I275_9PEZI|nr:hypothetical protein K490DRAFT_62169 [Saccharata proteae CBS 121410]
MLCSGRTATGSALVATGFAPAWCCPPTSAGRPLEKKKRVGHISDPKPRSFHGGSSAQSRTGRPLEYNPATSKPKTRSGRPGLLSVGSLKGRDLNQTVMASSQVFRKATVAAAVVRAPKTITSAERRERDLRERERQKREMAEKMEREKRLQAERMRQQQQMEEEAAREREKSRKVRREAERLADLIGAEVEGVAEGIAELIHEEKERKLEPIRQQKRREELADWIDRNLDATREYVSSLFHDYDELRMKIWQEAEKDRVQRAEERQSYRSFVVLFSAVNRGMDSIAVSMCELESLSYTLAMKNSDIIKEHRATGQAKPDTDVSIELHYMQYLKALELSRNLRDELSWWEAEALAFRAEAHITRRYTTENKDTPGAIFRAWCWAVRGNMLDEIRKTREEIGVSLRDFSMARRRRGIPRDESLEKFRAQLYGMTQHYYQVLDLFAGSAPHSFMNQMWISRALQTDDYAELWVIDKIFLPFTKGAQMDLRWLRREAELHLEKWYADDRRNGVYDFCQRIIKDSTVYGHQTVAVLSEYYRTLRHRQAELSMNGTSDMSEDQRSQLWQKWYQYLKATLDAKDAADKLEAAKIEAVIARRSLTLKTPRASSRAPAQKRLPDSARPRLSLHRLGRGLLTYPYAPPVPTRSPARTRRETEDGAEVGRSESSRVKKEVEVKVETGGESDAGATTTVRESDKSKKKKKKKKRKIVSRAENSGFRRGTEEGREIGGSNTVYRSVDMGQIKVEKEIGVRRETEDGAEVGRSESSRVEKEVEVKVETGGESDADATTTLRESDKSKKKKKKKKRKIVSRAENSGFRRGTEDRRIDTVYRSIDMGQIKVEREIGVRGRDEQLD